MKYGLSADGFLIAILKEIKIGNDEYFVGVNESAQVFVGSVGNRAIENTWKDSDVAGEITKCLEQIEENSRAEIAGKLRKKRYAILRKAIVKKVKR